MTFIYRESRGSHESPTDHRSESRLSIPRRIALQQSSSPLPQSYSIIKHTTEFVENDSTNSKCLIFQLSQFWGSPQMCGFYFSSRERPCSI
jgi:hypothetical protein